MSASPGRLPLVVRNLTTIFEAGTAVVRAVDRVSFSASASEIIGVVGESGSGKTSLGRSLLRLVPPPGQIVGGEILLNGRELLTLREHDMRRIRGKEISMIFQNPMRALHPAFTVGWQLREALLMHEPRTSKRAACLRARDLLAEVGVPDAANRMDDYPHQFSGGMQQRVMIAMSIINSPDVLVADEPTTALDVTVQAQILSLLRRLADERGMTVVLITHNFGVVASVCDRVIVMYAGQTVEEATVEAALAKPHHPYTRALLESLPERATSSRLVAVAGAPPQLDALPSGCRFRERCAFAEEVCAEAPELLPVAEAAAARCWVTQREGHLPPAPRRRDPAASTGASR